MHLPSKVHTDSCMPNVCDNNVYEAHMCASLYYFILDTSSTDKCTGQWHHGSIVKDELPEPRGSLANDIPSCATEQANQEVRQGDRHSQHMSNQASNA